VQYSSPAKYEARDQLRTAFRERGAAASAPDAPTIKRTLWFLDAAAREAGLEHRIVRNLLQVAWERRSNVKGIRCGVSAAQQCVSSSSSSSSSFLLWFSKDAGG